MTPPQRPTVTIDKPADLVAAVPHVLGFHPVDSLVVFGLRGPGARALGLTLRVDLPPLARARELAEHLLIPLAEHDTVGATLIIIGGHGRAPDDELPHRDLLAAVESVFADAGIPVVHQLWAADTAGGGRWSCYDEPDCGGIMPDPNTTPLAEAAAEAGVITYNRREDIVATLAPAPPDVLARRAAMLTAASIRVEPGGVPPSDPVARLAVIRTAVETAGAGPPTLDDDDVVRLADALADHRVRDLCLDFDAIRDIAAAERLWTALARATPAPERADPAGLLAYSAYARGDGVLAGIALDAAEKADPGSRLVGLLRSALVIGVPPERLRAAGTRAAANARRALAKERHR